MDRITLGNLELDRERFQVRIGGRAVDLSYSQFELLEQLCRRPGEVVDYGDLAQAIWGRASEADGGRLRIQISRLRKKIADSEPWEIKTVTKRGYALVNREAATVRLPAFVLTHAPVRRGPES